MSSHTAGPWHRNIPPATKYTTVWSGRNTHVAYVETKGLSPEEVEANIALIAAGPDLLEALKGAAVTLQAAADLGSEVAAHDLIIARKAISRAAGDQP